MVAFVDRRGGIDDEQVHSPAELFETALCLESVFFGGDDEIVCADDMTQGDLRLCTRLEQIEGITVLGNERGFVGESLELQHLGERALRLLRIQQPAFQIHHGSVGVKQATRSGRVAV